MLFYPLIKTYYYIALSINNLKQSISHIKLLGILLLSAFFTRVQATHIVGGGFDLQSLGANNYRITLVVYRDCINGQADFNDPLYIGIYSKENNALIDSVGIPLNRNLVSRINPSLPKCAIPVPGCTEKAIYSKVISLNPLLYNNDSGYYISWERCCRNNIIENIQQPGSASMAFYAEIPSPKRYVNSTPRLVNNPFTVLCIDNVFNYPLEFTDADGDSITYEMITPVNGTLTRDNPNSEMFGEPILNAGPYEPITWLPGYGARTSIKGSPPLGIGLNTGVLKVKPSETGVYVIAIKVREYRDGIEIGNVNLELQFTIINCITNTFPEVQLFERGMPTDKDTIEVTIPNKTFFGISVSDQDSLDSVYVVVPNTLPNLAALTSAFERFPRKVNYNWNFQTDCDLHGKPFHTFKVVATDKGCPIPKTVEYPFVVKVNPMPLHPQTDVLCIELRDNKETLVYFGDSARNFPYYKQYNIYRSAAIPGLYDLLDSIADRTANFYYDQRAENHRNIDHRYMIRVENVCGFEGLSSDTLGTFDQLKALPDKQYMYNVTVENDNVKIIWNKTKELDFARYFLWKGYRNQTPDQFVVELDFLKLTDTTYLDKKVMVNDTSHCYYLVMLDTCGNYGPAGEIFCTTLLKGNSFPFRHELFWTPFSRTDESEVFFNLWKYPPFESERLFTGKYNHPLLFAADENLDYDDGRYLYELDVEFTPIGWPSNHRAISRSNRTPLFQMPKVYIPNAFTPNGDGINDTWNVADVFVRDFVLKVYNRWGKLVFETRDKNNKWDGLNVDGSELAADTYVYTITYDGWDNDIRYATGNVTILR